MKIKISLKAARINANLTLKEVANKINVSAKTLCNWENGKNVIPAYRFYELCELYQIHSDFVQVPIIDNRQYE